MPAYFFYTPSSTVESPLMALTRSAPFPVVFSSSLSESLYPSHKLSFAFHIKNLPSLFVARSGDPGGGMLSSDAAVEKKIDGKVEAMNSHPVEEKKAEMTKMAAVPSFVHPGWIQGRWDLNQFKKGGRTDWDAVIDAEARRRQWLEGNPEASRNDESIPFNTSIIPWWVWAKRYYLPDPKLLKGKVAVFGFFVAYFVDSLTTVGLVDQRESFLWKSLLFLLVLGVLLLRKNEDFGKVKKFIEETTSYDNQWKAALKDDSLSNNKK